MTNQETRYALITGCSKNSLGEALSLALAAHSQSLTIFSSLRDPSKASSTLKSTPNIHIITLDVLSSPSIQSAVAEISAHTSGTLDILINNAGGGHYMPFLHLDLTKAKELFEINVWSYLTVTQAFLPLLMNGKSITGRKALLVNNTSISSVLKTPYHSAYGASKAAMAAFNDAQRIELRPFGITVVDLKTGSLESNFGDNRTNEIVLPGDSPYKPIEGDVLNVITGDATEAYAEGREGWARDVVKDLMGSGGPPAQIWRGGKAGTIRVTEGLEKVLPTGLGDSGFKDLGGLGKLEKIMKEKEKEKEKGGT